MLRSSHGERRERFSKRRHMDDAMDGEEDDYLERNEKVQKHTKNVSQF